MTDNKDAGELVTADELATRLKVTTRTLHRWKAAGMPFVQPGGHKGKLLFDEAAVREWAATQTEGAA